MILNQELKINHDHTIHLLHNAPMTCEGEIQGAFQGFQGHFRGISGVFRGVFKGAYRETVDDLAP